MISQLWEYDEAVRNSTGNFFCGVDEAGRGPLAGDVYAAAVVLDPDRPIEGLNDSKKLSAKSESCYMKKLLISLWIIVLQGLQLKKLKKSIF